MEYQKIKNLLENTPNQPTKFRKKNGLKINDGSREMHNTNSQIKFETSMLRSSLCDYSDPYILVSATIKVPNTAAAAAAAAANPSNRKNIIIKYCFIFPNCTSEVNNTQIDNAKEIDKVMPMYNLTVTIVIH